MSICLCSPVPLYGQIPCDRTTSVSEDLPNVHHIKLSRSLYIINLKRQKGVQEGTWHQLVHFEHQNARQQVFRYSKLHYLWTSPASQSDQVKITYFS
jgi:hypothetical protein